MNFQYYITPEDYIIAEKNGIKAGLLNQRVYVQGMNVEVATTKPVGKRNAYGWSEWKEVALANGIQYRTYLDRIQRKNMTFEQAATQPLLTKGETVKCMNEAKEQVFTPEQIGSAKSNGIPYSILWKRVNDLKWEVEKAITVPVMTNEESLEKARLAENSFRKQNEQYWSLVRSIKKAI